MGSNYATHVVATVMMIFENAWVNKQVIGICHRLFDYYYYKLLQNAIVDIQITDEFF